MLTCAPPRLHTGTHVDGECLGMLYQVLAPHGAGGSLEPSPKPTTPWVALETRYLRENC